MPESEACLGYCRTVWRVSECGVISNPYFPIFGVISGPCFPVFVLNAGICGVGRRIRSGCGGMRAGGGSVFGHF